MEFSVYTRSDTFYWTNNRVIYSIIFSCLAVVLINNGTGIIKSDVVNKICMGIMFSAFIAGIILSFIGITQVEPLRGKLDGTLIFEKDFIMVRNEIFPIETIHKIEISNDDYYGKFARVSRGNFDPALSNGTNNSVVLFMKSYQTKSFNFQLLNSDDFQKIRETLLDYHIMGKIEYWELAQVLGEKTTSETLQLTEEIRKRHNC